MGLRGRISCSRLHIWTKYWKKWVKETGMVMEIIRICFSCGQHRTIIFYRLLLYSWMLAGQSSCIISVCNAAILRSSLL